MFDTLVLERFCLVPRVTRQPFVALRSQDVYRHRCHVHKHPCAFIRLMARTQLQCLLGALALLTAEASLGGLSHGLGLVPRSQRSGLVKRRRVQAPATATDRIAQVTIGAYVAQVARPSLAALGARSTRLILRAGQWWRLATPMLLHGSPAHLMVNMLALRNVGGCVEIKQ